MRNAPFESEENCCGCGACMSKCPQNAIEMQRSEYGFLYPKILTDKCISCGLCISICPIGNDAQLTIPKAAYVVQSKSSEILSRSSSGGAFATLAKEIIHKGGAVIGCALDYTETSAVPKHMLISSEDTLPNLQGSKYAQSIKADIYQCAQKILDDKRTLLFSGTPCEVAALKKYLGKDYSNLITVDVICHGVPSDAMFADYIRFLEKKFGGKIVDFSFRDKSRGWALSGKVTYVGKDGELKTAPLPANRSSYYRLFLQGNTYRSSCYRCKYACMHRASDITIGDYWGIESQHPDYLKSRGGIFDEENGISCLLVNSPKGEKALELLAIGANIAKSSCAQVMQNNRQLQHPSQYHKDREWVMKLYSQFGYQAVALWFLFRTACRKCTVILKDQIFGFGKKNKRAQ